MRKAINLSAEQLIDKILALDVNQSIDFAGMTHRYSAQAVNAFAQHVILLGCYGGGNIFAISRNEDGLRDKIWGALKNCAIDWENEGCRFIENCGENYEKSIHFSKYNTDVINRALHEIPYSVEERVLNESAVITYTAEFENGYSVDIDLCGKAYKVGNGKENLPTVIAKLYDEDGKLLDFITSDEFFGKFGFIDEDGNTYTVAMTESPLKELVIKKSDLEIIGGDSIARFPTNDAGVSESVLVAVDEKLTRVVRDDTRENTYPNRYAKGYESAFDTNVKYKQAERCHKSNKNNDIER